jgi:hypothetical protein
MIGIEFSKMNITRLEIYVSKWKVLVTLLLLWGVGIHGSILFVEYSVSKGPYKDDLWWFRICVYSLVLIFLIYVTRIDVKRLARNSCNFFHGKPIFRLDEKSIEFSDLFKFSTSEIRGVQKFLCVARGAKYSIDWIVIIILTKNKIPLKAGGIERSMYENRLKAIEMYAKIGTGPPVPYGHFVVLDLSKTDCSVDKAYQFLNELIKQRENKESSLPASI